MKKSVILGGILLGWVFLTAPLAASAAVISIFPEKSEVYVGESVRLEVGFDSEGERINVAQVFVLVPLALEVKKVEIGGSLVDLWIEEPSYDPGTGIVKFIGGLTGGFAGRGFIGSIVVSPKEEGEIEVPIDVTSVVLLHDGAGTSALTVREGVKITAKNAPEFSVTSSTHPENIWSSKTTAEINWTKKDGAFYSWETDINPSTVPDTRPEEGEPPVKIEGLGDGMTYFHIREGIQVNGGVGWQEPVHYRLLVDTGAPKPYELLKIDENQVAVPARDDSSGIEKVLYRWESSLYAGSIFGKPSWKTVGRAELIKVPNTLKWFGGTLFVRAVDGAGNLREQTIQYAGISSLRVAAAVIPIVIAFAIIVGVWFVYYRKNKRV